MDQVFMCQTVFGIFLTAQTDLVNITVTTFLADHQLVCSPISRIKLDGNLVEGRSGQCIFRNSRTIRIEAHHAENSPGRHGSCIFISRQSVRFRCIMFGQQFLYQFLGSPFFSLEIAEKIRIGNVRFIGGINRTG